jgi:hypothetical protein
MSYRVTAPCVIAKDQGGHSHHFYEGAGIPWLSDVQAKHLLDENMVAVVDGASEPTDDGPPPKAAPKDAWVDFAVSKGGDRAEADALTKQELIELYGG